MISRGRFVWIHPRVLPLMNLSRFSSSGFQGQLMEAHILALCASNCIIRLICSWNSTSLKDVVDGSSRNVEFLNNKFGRIFVVFSTTNSLSKDPDIYSQTYWKNVLSSLLSMKVAFIAIICICDQKYFNNLVITLQEEDFVDDIFMEYVFYMVSKQEVPLSKSLGSLMNLPFLLYAYIFLYKKESLHNRRFWHQGIFQHGSPSTIFHF